MARALVFLAIIHLSRTILNLTVGQRSLISGEAFVTNAGLAMEDFHVDRSLV